MKKLIAAAVCVSVVACALVAWAAPGRPDDGVVEGVPILISPQMFLLGTEQAGLVTVHAEIAYSSVDSHSVTLDGIPVRFTFADSCGDLVAKFSEVEAKAIVQPPSTKLVLSGLTKDGVAFEGSDIVAVREWQ